MTDLKKCTKCRIGKSLDCFHKNKNKIDGLNNWCKSCKNENKLKNTEQRIKNRKVIEFKECSNFKCSNFKKMLPISMFNKDRVRKDGFCNWCKDCAYAAHKIYYSKNSKKIIIKHAIWVKDNPDKVKEYVKKVNTSEKGKIRYKRWCQDNKEKINKRSRDYAKNNRSKRNALWALHRADKLKRTPPWTTLEMKKDIQFLYASRSEMMNPKNWNIDHVVPLKGKLVSGLHVPWNLRLLEASPNFKKSNKFEPTCETFNPPITVNYQYKENKKEEVLNGNK